MWLLLTYGGKFNGPEVQDVRVFSTETIVNLKN